MHGALVALTLWVVAATAPPAATAPTAPPASTAPPAAPAPPGAPAAPAGKLRPTVSAEMQASIVAVNKVLGLESWPMRGFKSCVDRGGEGIATKEVSAEETRRCASGALTGGFPELGKSYALAILMASVGPATVMAVGLGDQADFAAYSCDPERKCPPTKIAAPTKWGKRLQERLAKACAAADTVWFPATAHPCPQ